MLTPAQVRTGRSAIPRDGFCADWDLVAYTYVLTSGMTLYVVGFTLENSEIAVPLRNQQELSAIESVIDWTQLWNLYIVFDDGTPF